MKYLRAAVILLFLLGIGVYATYQAEACLNQDTTIPQLTSDRELLELPSSYTEDMLLEGLTAYDGRDGDLTDQIMVRGMSHFQEKGVSNVNYVVFDSSGQSASLTRPVRFVDYESPRYTLTEPLIFEAGRGGRGMDRIGAWDAVEGDISSQVVQTGSSVNYNEAGDYSIEVEVANRFGDLQSASLPVHIRDNVLDRAGLELAEPLIYISQGAMFDPMAYGPSITGLEEGNELTEIRAEAFVNTEEPGVYEVHYQAVFAGEGETSGEILGETWLVVIVREQE